MKFDELFANLQLPFFTRQISPGGRVGGFHMLRCQGFEVNHYDFTLGRLAYESLRLVQKSGK
jgi:hypothetical protein